MCVKIFPKPLKKGDTIGIIAPSGSIKEPHMLETTIANIQNAGYNIKISSNFNDKFWYMAGNDDIRLTNLMNFFLDKNVNAIISARGGYGAIRLLDKIDYNIIVDNPKIFIGYSDITALHLAINKYANLVTFHGPLGLSDFGKMDLDKFTIKSFWDIMEGNISLPFTVPNYLTPVCINKGRVMGELIGGNLATICSLIGSKYLVNFTNKILFIEDVGESLYRIDRYLMQLKLSGILETVNGIIFGEFSDITISQTKEVNSITPLDIIKDIMKDLKTPAIYGFSCGHNSQKSTLAIGAECFLDCFEGKLQFVKPFFN